MREVGWAGGEEDKSGKGVVAWIYREEGGGQARCLARRRSGGDWRGWRMGEEKLEVDEEWMEEEMMLQGMKIMEERRNAFGAEELTVEQGFRPLAW